VPESGETRLQPGKLPADVLARCLAKIPRHDRRVVLWPAIGEDAAAIDFGDTFLVAKTDPITFAEDLIGWYAVHVNANDIATCGAVAQWFMATVLLPEGAQEALAESVFDQLLRACKDLDIALVGGHIEVTPQVARPVVVGCMLGEVVRAGLIRTSGAQVGDTLVVTKGIAVEGTALLAREAAAELGRRGVTDLALRRASEFLFTPGISIVPEARILALVPGAHAMHDPTEGGLATGLVELASASQQGLRVREDAIPILPECREICTALGLDPLGLIASGSLLASLAPDAVDKALAALGNARIPAAVIGEVRPRREGLILEAGSKVRPLPAFERDELARYFENQ
jgi:hydrogenase expression/formation protein HypE